MYKIEFNNACYEVLEILKYVKKEDLLKIPLEDLQMLERNANLNCNFKYDPQRSIKEQNVSKLAKGIIAVYFSKYVTSPKQREKIILKQKNDLKIIEYDGNNYLRDKQHHIVLVMEEDKKYLDR